MIKSAMQLLPAVGLALGMSGCMRAQEAFLTVQVCVESQQGQRELIGMMRAVAQSQGLIFIDNSEGAGKELTVMGADQLLKRDAAKAFDVHIEGSRGLGVTASNLSLPPYQIALGFTEGSNPSKAHRLSGQLIQAISERWHVETVPQGKGVMPMPACHHST